MKNKRTEGEKTDMKNVFSYLANGKQKYSGPADEYVRFIIDRQLTDKELWRKFVRVFETREDAEDNGWRGEYFGKMMRGAALTYRYSPNEELYGVLEEAVRALISAADEEGRIATYPADREFRGWDLWVRKYVLVGCLYFYDICKSEALKEKILSALVRHADYLLDRIGEGKTDITDTSEMYGGMNSSSILEPIVELYNKTGFDRYLAFAEYLVSRGGCKNGSVLDAVRNGTLPHEFPTTKAYETISYMEGVLAYAVATSNEELADLAEKFWDSIYENEITIIGSAGCRDEHFDHAIQTQTKKFPNKYIMQETCVTVTWMRFSERLLRLTGKAKFADAIEISALNALYGSVNLGGNKQYCKEEKRFLEGVPFDSYSPLVSQRRGVGIGGFKRFSEGGYYGCCACIGAAGVALYPLSSAMKTEEGVTILFYNEGTVEFVSPKGDKVAFEISGDLALGEIKLVCHAEKPVEFSLGLRIPAWSVLPSVRAFGESFMPEGGFFALKRVWEEGAEVRLSLNPSLVREERGGKVAFRYGPFTLAREQGKESFFAPRKIRLPETSLEYEKEGLKEGERVRLKVRTAKAFVLLSDYASCGKNWMKRRSRVTVWQEMK